MDRGNDLQTFECFEAALGLPCFRCLIAESVDEGLHVMHLFLLAHVLFILYFNPRGPSFFRQAVVSFVDLNRTIFDVRNASD